MNFRVDARQADLDAENLAGGPVSWGDLIAWAARGKTKAAFDAVVMSRAKPGKAELLMTAYGNEFPFQPLGAVDDMVCHIAPILLALNSLNIVIQLSSANSKIKQGHCI